MRRRQTQRRRKASKRRASTLNKERYQCGEEEDAAEADKQQGYGGVCICCVIRCVRI